MNAPIPGFKPDSDVSTSAYTRTLEELALVKALQDELRERGIVTVLAGGAVRDMLHGRIPKDYDLLVIGEGSEEAALAASYLLSGNVGQFAFGSSFVGSDKLDWVLKVNLAGIIVDIIRHNRPYASPKEVVEHFDCTINMAWYDSTSDVMVKHPRFPAFGDRVFLTEYCDDPVRRVSHLSEKYPYYQWPTMAEMQFHPNYQGARC